MPVRQRAIGEILCFSLPSERGVRLLDADGAEVAAALPNGAPIVLIVVNLMREQNRPDAQADAQRPRQTQANQRQRDAEHDDHHQDARGFRARLEEQAADPGDESGE